MILGITKKNYFQLVFKKDNIAIRYAMMAY